VADIEVVAQRSISATTGNGIDTFRDLLIEQAMGLKWYDDQVIYEACYTPKSFPYMARCGMLVQSNPDPKQ
jgi:hypothetical protein